MKKLFTLLLVSAAIFISSCQRDPESPGNDNGNGNGPQPYCLNVEVPINSSGCGESATTPLVAGKYSEVGYVRAQVVGGFLHVTYHITETDWRVTLTHLDVEGVYSDMPVNGGGNPQIGHFEYGADLSPGQYVWHSPPIDVSGFSSVDIAAHAEVIHMAQPLEPNSGYYTMNASVNSPSNNTYIGVVLSDTEGNRSFDTWCLDYGTAINSSTNYDVYLHDVADLTDTDYECLGVEYPDNMDLVQYLVNQQYPCASKLDLQVAIWQLVDDSAPTVPTTSLFFDVACVQSIVDDAEANGEGYIPDPCDDKTASVIDGKCDVNLTNQTEVQTLLLIREPDCPPYEVIGEETAWACGTGFPGNSWAMYFTYCVQ